MAKTRRRKERRPRCLLIAGPNGAGKTTFAREYLPNDARVLNFVNADLIASGLSPLRPELAAVSAARLMLDEIDRLVERRADFAWESTLSGLGHVKRLQIMKRLGYHVEIVYLRLASFQVGTQTHSSQSAAGWAQRAKGGRTAAVLPKLAELRNSLTAAGRRLGGV